jgi:protocatechuate 3,4-dioxygenase beta subunit
VRGYRRDQKEVDPPFLSPGYRATILRAPKRPFVPIEQSLTEITGPVYGHDRVEEGDDDLTTQHDGEALGQRITVAGRVLDGDGRPVPDALIEVWQANACGRYRHQGDQHPAPLDPNFSGAGRCVTDGEGNYKFTTIQPGAYPWPNHYNAWRAAHIHFSLFGPAFATRLVTQMYFPGDPLFFQDPIYNGVRDEGARKRMISSYDHSVTVPQWALGYRFDIVLGGAAQTPLEES